MNKFVIRYLLCGFLLTSAVSLSYFMDKPTHTRVVHVMNWSEYIDPDVLVEFEKETGIKVIYDVMDSVESVETKMLTGYSGYDVIFPTAMPNMARMAKAGVLKKLDTAKLSNIKHLDNHLVDKLLPHDGISDRAIYGIPYLWGTAGIAYDMRRVREHMPHAPIHSWRMFFDPTVLKHFKDCQVSMFEAVTDVISPLYIFLAFSLDSEDMGYLETAFKHFKTVRPMITRFKGALSRDDLVKGDLCYAQMWSNDFRIAREQVEELKLPADLVYVIPEEGSTLWCDVMAIPIDAPHTEEAYAFINFIMRPDIIARISVYVHCANANKSSWVLLPEAFKKDEVINPPEGVLKRLHLDPLHSPHFESQKVRAFSKMIMLGR